MATTVLPHLLLYQESGPRLRDPHAVRTAAAGPSDQHCRLGEVWREVEKQQEGGMTKFPHDNATSLVAGRGVCLFFTVLLFLNLGRETDSWPAQALRAERPFSHAT